MLERFKEIFAGLQTAYGQTKVTDELSENGKHEAKSFTIKKPVTDLLWKAHLDGAEPALGIVPIREDNKLTKSIERYRKSSSRAGRSC